tara:strand:- start:201 stop:593 length:393 start_codon:yes stop_codon:yes gene_type:complete
MKILLTISTLVFTVMFSSTSFAGWTKVSENVSGDTFYVDFERIRKHDGYVYFWKLIDFLKPNPFGEVSSKTYEQGDCKLFRYKDLSVSYHKEPMGGGTGHNVPISKKSESWKYPPPDSIIEFVLESVCSR